MTSSDDDFPVRLGRAFPTWPPLVHFTTADLSHLAEGLYDVTALSDRLKKLDATVIITPEHLAEMVPLYSDSRERRLRLLDAIPRVAYLDWSASLAWPLKPTQVSIESTSSDGIRDTFLTPEGTPAGWLLKRRDFERRVGDAEFFQRSARLARQVSQGVMTDEEYADLQMRRATKFQKQNAKHGSSIIRVVKLSSALALRAAAIQKRLHWLVPKRIRDAVVRIGTAATARLDALLAPIEASSMGVGVDNYGFRLWWEVKQRLWGKEMEVGGLGERIDLHEFRWWPLCSLLTLDKRVMNAAIEATRSLKEEIYVAAAERFARCGNETAIHAKLDYLLSLLAEHRAREKVEVRDTTRGPVEPPSNFP